VIAVVVLPVMTTTNTQITTVITAPAIITLTPTTIHILEVQAIINMPGMMPIIQMTIPRRKTQLPLRSSAASSEAPAKVATTTAAATIVTAAAIVDLQEVKLRSWFS
jgi:hypothetical protein